MMILLVDQAGNPTKWIPPKDAAVLIATGKVGWDIGDDVVVLRGGHGKDGVQSTLGGCTRFCVNGFSFKPAVPGRQTGWRNGSALLSSPELASSTSC